MTVPVSSQAVNSGSQCRSVSWIEGRPRLVGSSVNAIARHPARRVPADLGPSGLRVPQRDQTQREQPAAAVAAPLLDHPVVVRRDTGERELLVLCLQEDLAGEAREARKAQRSLGLVEVHVCEPRLGVVTTRAHSRVRDRRDRQFLAREAGAGHDLRDGPEHVLVHPKVHHGPITAADVPCATSNDFGRTCVALDPRPPAREGRSATRTATDAVARPRGRRRRSPKATTWTCRQLSHLASHCLARWLNTCRHRRAPRLPGHRERKSSSKTAHGSHSPTATPDDCSAWRARTVWGAPAGQGIWSASSHRMNSGNEKSRPTICPRRARSMPSISSCNIERSWSCGPASTKNPVPASARTTNAVSCRASRPIVLEVAYRDASVSKGRAGIMQRMAAWSPTLKLNSMVTRIRVRLWGACAAPFESRPLASGAIVSDSGGAADRSGANVGRGRDEGWL